MALGDQSEEMLRLTYRSLGQLRKDAAMAIFIKECIMPILDKKIKMLKREEGHSDVRYLQGYIAGVERCVNLDEFLKTYKIKIEKHG